MDDGERCCENCLHWQQLGNGRSGFGECRIAPPTVTLLDPVWLKGGDRLDGANRTEVILEHSIWPVTGYDDWCGEYGLSIGRLHHDT